MISQFDEILNQAGLAEEAEGDSSPGGKVVIETTSSQEKKSLRSWSALDSSHLLFFESAEPKLWNSSSAMPRIPVRTEPYTSSTRQHRHFKSKRDLILRTLGKSSYINGSQFVIAWVSAKGEVETYASELLQDNVEDVLDMEVLKQLAVQVREGADRKRTQLEEIQRKRREEGGLLDDQGRVVDEWADMEPAEKASHLLRSAKKAKAGRVAAEKAAKNGEDGLSGQPMSAVGKGKQRARDPPLTPSRQMAQDAAGDATLVADEDVEEDDDDEEGEEEYEEEAEVDAEDESMESVKPETLVDISTLTTISPALALAQPVVGPIVEPKKEDQVDEQGDITLVDVSTSAFLATPSGESISTSEQQQVINVSSTEAPKTTATNVRHVQVTMAGSPLSIRSGPRTASSGKRAMLMSATPSRSTAMLASNGFVTPSMSYNGRATTILAPTPTSGKTSGLMNNVLEGSSGPQPRIMLGKSNSADKSHMPRLSGHIRTPSHPAGPAKSPMGTPTTPFVPTRSIKIRENDLKDWYAERFESLQQETCRLVVKNWIKVIEPKKQSKFPYNRGDDCRPGWWPENIRHREPDHLQKPERTQILVSLIRSSLVPISKLELSTAESTAYITKPRMRTLRDIYKVAKEDEKRRMLGDVSDLVVNVPASPPARLTTVARMTILDEMVQQMKEEDMGPEPGRPSNAMAENGGSAPRQDLASPCVILPSATLSAFAMARHQKTGSIGESVFLGAAAIKKRKLDELTLANKENIAPNGAGPSKAAKTRKAGMTPIATAAVTTQTMVRPQSTGAIRNGKQSSKAAQRMPAANGLTHPGLAMSEIVSPVDHTMTNRPWSTTGTRTLGSGGPSWIADTPTNQRQQRLHQIQGEGLMRSMSRDSALSAPQAMPNVFGGHPMQPDFVGMNPHVQGGMLYPGPSGSGGMELYITDVNGQPRLLPPNTIPVHARARHTFPIQHDPNHLPGVQYIQYGVHQGMPPFSAAPQQGTFMVYEQHPPLVRTNSTNSVASVESRQSHRPSVANQSQQTSLQHGVSMTPQAYTYPSAQYSQLPYQYIHTEPSASHGMPLQGTSHPFNSETHRMMAFTPGMASVNDENAPGTIHSRGSSKMSTGMRCSGTKSLSAPGSRPATSHAGPLDMTMSMPLSTSTHANSTAAEFEAGLTGLGDVDGEDVRSAGATSSRNSQRGKHTEMTLVAGDENHGIMSRGVLGQAILPDTTATHHEGDHLGDGHGMPAAPIVLEPTHHARELSEMETVEREFVKFSDGSDRDAFWTNDPL